LTVSEGFSSEGLFSPEDYSRRRIILAGGLFSPEDYSRRKIIPVGRLISSQDTSLREVPGDDGFRVPSSQGPDAQTFRKDRKGQGWLALTRPASHAGRLSHPRDRPGWLARRFWQVLSFWQDWKVHGLA